MKIKFWGVRGSIPSPSPQTVKIGGNTTCIEVDTGSKLIIFDAGTGIRYLGIDLLSRIEKYNNEVSIFFTHSHWDHIQGFPFFLPAYNKRNKIRVYGSGDLDDRLEIILRGQMEPPFFPVRLEQLGANLQFEEIHEGRLYIDDVEMYMIKLNHPNYSFGYRVKYEDKVFIIATDTEHQDNESSNGKLIEIIKGADVLAYDAQYTPNEYVAGRQGWGHSTYESGIELCLKANVKKLVLTHHDPSHTDEQVFEIEKSAKQMIKDLNSSLEVIAAYEGLTIDV